MFIFSKIIYFEYILVLVNLRVLGSQETAEDKSSSQDATQQFINEERKLSLIDNKDSASVGLPEDASDGDVNSEVKLDGKTEKKLICLLDSLKKYHREGALDGLWPLGVIPFAIDTNVFDETMMQRVRDAMDVLQTASCLQFNRFIPGQIDYSDIKWLNITNPARERECSHNTTIRKSGEISVVLGLDCLKRREILHTLLHAVGLRDEVNHPRREQYISVIWENLQPQYQSLFSAKGTSEQNWFEYDPLSIMHFHERAFSKNGQATIVPLAPGLLIQPSDHLSQLDRMKLGMMFNRECNRRTVENLYNTCKKTFLQKMPLSVDMGNDIKSCNQTCVSAIPRVYSYLPENRRCSPLEQYRDFFDVDDNVHRDNDNAFKMGFAIFGDNISYLLLTTSYRLGNQDRVYEIEVGKNERLCIFRLKINGAVVVETNTDGPLLAALDYRPFLLRVSRSGVLEFGRDGEGQPLVVYRDPTPMFIKYFSFKAVLSHRLQGTKFLFDYQIPFSDPVKRAAVGCKEFTCRIGRGGFDYGPYHEILNGTHRKNKIAFELHFSVVGNKDFHVLLTTSPSLPNRDEPAYEFVIGIRENTRYEIRRKTDINHASTMALKNSPFILSPINYEAFYVRVHQGGLIELGKENDNESLLTYRDPQPLSVNYFSFSLWSANIRAKILYDCDKPFYEPLRGTS